MRSSRRSIRGRRGAGRDRPWLGAMTQPLLERCGRLTVIELDRDLAARLRRDARPRRRRGRCRRWISRTGRRAPAASCAWSATCPTTSPRPSCSTCCRWPSACSTRPSCCRRRWSSAWRRRPAARDYGRLSVMLQWRYDIESLLDVPPEAFDRRRRASIRRWCACSRCRRWPVSMRRSARSSPWFSQRRKLLRTRWDAGWKAAAAATSTCSAAPRKCRWPSTLGWWRACAAAEMTTAAGRPPSREHREISARSGGVQPHRGIEGAAHHRHVHAEAGIGRALWRPACRRRSGSFPSPAP